MPKFVFTLESVLRHRTFAEQERLRDLAVVQAEMTRLQDELKALNDSMQASARDMKANHLTGSLDVNYLAAHRRYTVATQRRGMTLVQEMARQQRKVDEAQRLLAEAAKERKILEKLKERHLERWKADESRRELAETDEVGAQWGYRQQDEARRLTEAEMVSSAADAGESLSFGEPSRAAISGFGPPVADGGAKPQASSTALRRNDVDSTSRGRA
jgi:flagellar FliJ protein